MHLSTRGRYAIMAMLDLAQLANSNRDVTMSRPVTLAQIAERQQISLSYLEQLFAKLRKSGVVDSVRGPGGGYMIPKPLNLVMLADIVNAVDEVIDLSRCGSMGDPHGPSEGAGCVHGRKCNAHDLWNALGGHIEDFLRKVSLQMVLDGDFDTSSAGLPPMVFSGVRIVEN
ncbi:MAG: Rrf2 family transcriptional regulator [Alphaproteobacteria bacterium]|nr:MAG: Rrf2 family transcriptional regulator [Alphaproteobacteria bacterium]